MKLNKDNISQEDKEQAIAVLNHLKSNQRVIGTPGQGLKLTLKELEDKRDSVELKNTDWALKDTELLQSITLLKVGIKGEEDLAYHLTKILKYNDQLDGLVAFASLSYDYKNTEKDYIPDSDFLIVYDRHILIIDAKNLSTKPNIEIQLEYDNHEYSICTVGDRPKVLLDGIHSSENFWTDYLSNNNLQIKSITNLICIVNETGATIQDSHLDVELIHIVDLEKTLLDWKNAIKDDNDKYYLDLLTSIAKTQVRKEKSSLDLKDFKSMFNVG